MFCKNCGSYIEDGKNYCVNCGEKIISNAKKIISILDIIKIVLSVIWIRIMLEPIKQMSIGYFSDMIGNFFELNDWIYGGIIFQGFVNSFVIFITIFPLVACMYKLYINKRAN